MTWKMSYITQNVAFRYKKDNFGHLMQFLRSRKSVAKSIFDKWLKMARMFNFLPFRVFKMKLTNRFTIFQRKWGMYYLITPFLVIIQ